MAKLDLLMDLPLVIHTETYINQIVTMLAATTSY